MRCVRGGATQRVADFDPNGRVAGRLSAAAFATDLWKVTIG